MPKINLLASAVTEPTAPAPKPAQATGQILLVVGALLALIVIIAVDYSIVTSDANAAKDRLKKEQEAKKQLEEVKKQAEEFKKRKDLVEGRLTVIKKLSAEQRGPVAVLSNINERLPQGVNLVNIKQRGSEIMIEGTTKKKELVTEFAQQLERFSNGLFTNVDPTLTLEGASQQNDVTEESIFRFTISCKYNPPQPPGTPTDASTQPGGNKTASTSSPPGK